MHDASKDDQPQPQQQQQPITGMPASLRQWVLDWCDLNAGPGPWLDPELANRMMGEVPFSLVPEALRPRLVTLASNWTRARGVATPLHGVGTGATKATTHPWEQLTLALAVERLQGLAAGVDARRGGVLRAAEEMAPRLGVAVADLLTQAGLDDYAA